MADLYAQRIAADGTVRWAANGVAICTAVGDQSNPAIISDGAGGAIITWQDRRGGSTSTYYDIYAQRISADGVVQWTADGAPVCVHSYFQGYPALAPDGANGAIIAWQDSRGGTSNIYAQRILSSGAAQWAANGVAVCAAAYLQGTPLVVSDNADGAIIAWDDFRSNTNHDIYAQHVSSAGAVGWTTNGVAICTASGNQMIRAIVSDDAGGAIIAWEDSRLGDADIYAQHISSAGAIVVGWPTDGAALCATTGAQTAPAMIADGAGGAIVTWQDARGDAGDIYAQRVSAAGAVQWTADGVPICTVTGDQGSPVIVVDDADSEPGAIIAWQDHRGGANYDIYALRITNAGEGRWAGNGVPMCTSANDQSQPTIVSDKAGGAIVAWQDYRNGTTNADIYCQRIWGGNTTPALVSLVSADVGADAVTLTWFAGASTTAAATVYRSSDGDGWTPIGEVAADGTGYLRYVDHADVPATHLGYRLGIPDGSGERYYGETWVDRPALEPALGPALTGISPNPLRGGPLAVRFTLPNASGAALELLDIAGRRIAVREVGSLGPGKHTVDLAAGTHMPPGLYLVRLTTAGRTLTARVAAL